VLRAQPFVVYEDAENRERLIEVLTLADECADAWDVFLIAQGLV